MENYYLLRLFLQIPIMTDCSNNWPDYEYGRLIGTALLHIFFNALSFCFNFCFLVNSTMMSRYNLHQIAFFDILLLFLLLHPKTKNFLQANLVLELFRFGQRTADLFHC